MSKADSGKTIAERHTKDLQPFILGMENAIRHATPQTFGGRLLAALSFEVSHVAALVSTGQADALEAGFTAFVKELKHTEGWLRDGVD